MVKINTIDAINKSVEAAEKGGHRAHLGGSQIGAPCERALWYQFRWTDKAQFDGRMLRLFRRGQNEEDVMIADLRAAGVEVVELDPSTGNQVRIAAVSGHFGGSIDGTAKGIKEMPTEWVLLEFKTHNEKSFKELQKKGVEAAKPQHFAQMQVYMYRTGAKACYYMAVNKNTDHLYGELVRANDKFGADLIAKASDVIKAEAPPPKISRDPSWYQCRFCDFSDVCHQEKWPEINCRTCANASPVVHDDPLHEGPAVWRCGHWDQQIPEDAQREGCEDHRYVPDLIQIGGVEVIKQNKTENTTTFNVGGHVVTNGKAPLGYSSEELPQIFKKPEYANAAAIKAARSIGGKVEFVGPSDEELDAPPF